MGGFMDSSSDNLKDSPKEVFMKTINLRKAERYPVALHWWGVYKYESAGLDYKRDAWQEAAKISEVYSQFYEKFKPDWFHLHIGTPSYFEGSQIIEKKEKSYLIIDPSQKDIKKLDKYFSVNTGADEEIVDFPDYLLGSRSYKPKIELGNKKSIDEYIKKYIHMDSRLITHLGYTDHVKIISDRYGSEIFIGVHIPSAICEIFDPKTGYIGFEQGLLAFHDYPEGMRYLLERCYEEQLEWAKAYDRAGAHAYIISESYISPDIVNPQIYRNFMKDIHADYFSEIKKIGLIPICMFWGDVNLIIPDLLMINASALMFEESKKGFILDVRKIREKIGDRICVFGNIDSISLLHSGTPEDIRKEVEMQLGGANNNFITCNGSPITPGTPLENIRAMMEAGREG